MAEETNKTPAAQEPSMDELLTQAAAGAVEDAPETQEPPADEPEVTEEQPAEEAKPEEHEEGEVDEDGLPKDHKSRSDLGRKLAASHRRLDTIEQSLARIAQYVEQGLKPKVEPPKNDDIELDPDEPVTFKEIEKILSIREQRRVQQLQQYNDGYLAAVQNAMAEYDDIKEADGVLEELKTLRYNPSNDPEKDALANLRKAERAFLKKQAAGPKPRVNPLKGEPPKTPLGTAAAGKTVAKETVLPKLDAHGESYLKFVTMTDGAEKAEALRRGAAKEA